MTVNCLENVVKSKFMVRGGYRILLRGGTRGGDRIRSGVDRGGDRIQEEGENQVTYQSIGIWMF